jgi:predicted phage terminase large subunit-like protein
MSVLPIKWSKTQREYFFGDHGKYRVMTKGRRVGFTHGAANFCISHSLDHDHRILWGDTIHANLDRYVERYFLPVLKHLPQSMWSWNAQKKEMKILDSIIDFRSAERAENWEGFGYHRIILNEAGLILKGDRGRYLWNNAVLPMTADYEDCIVFFGGTPKGRTDKDGKDCLYYDLAQRGMRGEPGYYHVNIPTHKNPFINQATVQEVIAELPEGPIRDQEAFGKFVDAGSGIIKREWLRVEDIQLRGTMAIGVDLAVSEKESADDTAFCCMVRAADNQYQVIDVERHKLIWPEAKKKLMDFIEIHNCPAYIEDNAQMAGLVDDLKREARMQKYSIKGVKTTKDKITCASPWISRLENGHLTMLRGSWNPDYMNQLIAFTVEDKGRKDDMIDATSRAYEALMIPQISFGVV